MHQRSGPWNSKNHELLAETLRLGGNQYLARYLAAAGLDELQLNTLSEHRRSGIGIACRNEKGDNPICGFCRRVE